MLLFKHSPKAAKERFVQSVDGQAYIGQAVKGGKRSKLHYAPVPPLPSIFSGGITPELLSEALGRSLVDRKSLPEFTMSRPDTMPDIGAVGLLETNEKHDETPVSFSDLHLRGSFVGCGFGMSFLLLRRFFTADLHAAVFCAREPYVYLMGKMFLLLLRRCGSLEEALLHIVNRRFFEELFQEAVADEAPTSPLFLRGSRDEMMAKVPADFHHLRMALYAQWSSPLETDDILQFLDTSKSKKLIGSQKQWISRYLSERASSVMRTLQKEYKFFNGISERMVPVCADVLHPYFWGFLATQRLWWEHPSLIYLSNEAERRIEMDGRGTLGHSLAPYDPEVLSAFKREVEADLYFAHTPPPRGGVRITHEVPERGAVGDFVRQAG